MNAEELEYYLEVTILVLLELTLQYKNIYNI